MTVPLLCPDETLIKDFFATPQDRFINRELSWLEFNDRILQEARNVSHPLLERLRFLSISAGNLDEFYMVRVAGLKDQIRHGITALSQDGLSPQKQLEKIYARSHQLMREQQECWYQLKQLLLQENIEVIEKNAVTPEDMLWLKGHFLRNIFPALTPIAIDPAHPFPFLPNLGLAVLLQLRRIGQKKKLRAVIPLPQKLSRFILLPGKKSRFILLEDIILLFHDLLFPSCDALRTGVIRITRDSELELSEEAEDLIRHFEHAVKQRRRGSVIRLETTISLPDMLRNFVVKKLLIVDEDVIETEDMLGLVNICELLDVNRPELKFPPYVARFPERVTDFGGDCFAAIHAKDIIIHHPYESFDVVVQFLRQAACDPSVIAIKQTLYRTSNDSEIVKALIEAAEEGKSVTAVVELKARFDEEANIRLARDLERAGVQVVYGIVGLKTHGKISLVVRRVGEGLRSYVHFGTGNYHPITAKSYSDLSFFTCDKALCNDAAHLFNYLTGYSPPAAFEKIAMAPLTLREKLLTLIEEEVSHAKAGRPASIWIKVNAMVDSSLIDALYYASQQGVSIDLVVRGICSLRPGIKGFSDNIRVKSIVGRFLEHARIYCFGAGNMLPSPRAKVFIASADCMQRNFFRRVEVLTPIENDTVHEQVMGQIMAANLKDQKQSWALEADGSYKRFPFDVESFSAHDFFMTNPSLSGRGTALNKGKTNGK